MRPAWAIGIGLASAAVVVVLVRLAAKKTDEPDPRLQDPSYREGRAEGLQIAEKHIRSGTPYIRSFLGSGDLSEDGYGIDLDTGLPLRNSTLMCGTGVDMDRYRAKVEAYNERIRAAWREGTLKPLSLRHKLRTKGALRELFAESKPIVLTRNGDTLRTADGTYVIGYRHKVWDDGSESHRLTMKGPRVKRDGRWAVYPCRYVDRPGVLYPTYPLPPFEGWIVDDETTAILRDGDGYAWVIDLPQGITVQVAGPIR